MSDLAISRTEVERVKAVATRVKEECQDVDDRDGENAMDTLVEFCDVLLGRTTVDSFLRSQDMES